VEVDLLLEVPVVLLEFVSLVEVLEVLEVLVVVVQREVLEVVRVVEVLLIVPLILLCCGLFLLYHLGFERIHTSLHELPSTLPPFAVSFAPRWLLDW
jgi:hypothetical protein